MRFIRSVKKAIHYCKKNASDYKRGIEQAAKVEEALNVIIHF